MAAGTFLSSRHLHYCFLSVGVVALQFCHTFYFFIQLKTSRVQARICVINNNKKKSLKSLHAKCGLDRGPQKAVIQRRYVQSYFLLFNSTFQIRPWINPGIPLTGTTDKYFCKQFLHNYRISEYLEWMWPTRIIKPPALLRTTRIIPCAWEQIIANTRELCICHFS